MFSSYWHHLSVQAVPALHTLEAMLLLSTLETPVCPLQDQAEEALSLDTNLAPGCPPAKLLGKGFHL